MPVLASDNCGDSSISSISVSGEGCFPGTARLPSYQNSSRNRSKLAKVRIQYHVLDFSYISFILFFMKMILECGMCCKTMEREVSDQSSCFNQELFN
jgi:hypothetical protein